VAVTSDHVLWAYRILLDREPDDEGYGTQAAHFESVKELRRYFLSGAEYNAKNSGWLSDAVVICDLTKYGMDGRLYINLSDGIGLGIAQGTYERHEIEFVKSNLKAGQTFVDLGANIGLFSIIASSIVKSTGKVYALEALSNNVAMLKRSIGENPFCRNVTAIRAIVADRSRGDMFIAHQPLEDGSGSSGGSFIVDGSESLPPFLRKESVQQDTLDKLIGTKTPVHFIKMDIEGAEALAMRGAKRILTEQSPIILSEVHTDQLLAISKVNWMEYFNLMKQFGYRAHFIKNAKLDAPARDLEGGKIYNVAFVKA